MRRRVGRGIGAISALLCVACGAAAPSAWATASMSLTSDLAPALQVGKRALAGTITLTNTSTGAQSDGGLVFASLTLTPSCGQTAFAADCSASFRDPGVFAVNDHAVGSAGTACAGVAFTVSMLDPLQGKLQLTPTDSAPVVLTKPSGANPTCRIDFVFDVLKMAGFDADASAPGIQTGRIAVAAATNTSDASAAATITPALSTTIARADVAISGSPDGGVLNLPSADSVTLTGNPAAPPLTGTVTFNLYGAQDPSCSGAPLLTSAAPVSGSGTYASDPFTPTTVGTYRWVASYSGDANNAAAATACSDRSQALSARAAIVTTGQPSRVGRIGATLTGSINSGGAATTYVFEYGTSVAYSNRTPEQALGAGNGAVPAAAILSGLRANTTYHYRLVATNGGGSITAADATFKTKPKVAPKRLSVTASPHRDGRAPYRFVFRGKLVLPSSVTTSQGCGGAIVIRASSGSKTLSTTRSAITKKCAFAKRVTIRSGSGATRRLKVTVSYLGNRVLTKRSVTTVIRTG